MSDIDTGVVDSLKALDPEWPIREADIEQAASVIVLGAKRGASLRQRRWRNKRVFFQLTGRDNSLLV